MATYVISDIHGQYDMFTDLLYKIGLNDEDDLYVLGDTVDRGPHPIKMLKKLMDMPNAECLVGNHELMAIENLEFLINEITEESIKDLDEETMMNLITWFQNGGQTTLKEFRELDIDGRKDIIDFIEELLIYEELSVNGQDYLLVHAGLGNYYPGKEIGEYSIKELVWDRAEYDVEYYPDKFVITGHTPTQYIGGNPRPGFIYRNNNHIALDCGCCIPGGRLGAICLENGKEFYSFSHK